MSDYYKPEEVTEYWNHEWAISEPLITPELYAGKHAWFEDRFSHLLPEWKAESRVLDVGCGICLYAEPLLRHFQYYDGIDTGLVPLALAEKHVGLRMDRRRWDAKPYDGRVFPFPNDSFNCVMTITVLQHQHPESRVNLIGEIKRVLKSGGLYIGLEQQGETRARDMPAFPVEDWLRAWEPMRLVYDAPEDRPEFAQDNVWTGRKP